MGPQLQPRPPTAGDDLGGPADIARACEAAGVRKASQDAMSLFVLGILAGAFIAFGGVFFITVLTGAEAMPWGAGRLLAAIAFSLGLILVIVGGAELFTGDALMVVARTAGLISTASLLRAWILVYAGNIVGAVGTAAIVFLAGEHLFANGAVGRTALAIAEAKSALPLGRLFFLAVLCNVLVCLAVWMSFAARRVAGKVLVIVPPIAAFVVAGFEHSIANLFFLPFALFIKAGAPAEFWTAIGRTASDYPILQSAAALRNIAVSTVGNLLGGSVLVGVVYWFVYLRPGAAKAPPRA